MREAEEGIGQWSKVNVLHEGAGDEEREEGEEEDEGEAEGEDVALLRVKVV